MKSETYVAQITRFSTTENRELGSYVVRYSPTSMLAVLLLSRRRYAVDKVNSDMISANSASEVRCEWFNYRRSWRGTISEISSSELEMLVRLLAEFVRRVRFRRR